MIPAEVWVMFLGYTVPMVFSPGPGNTVLATAGGRFGIRGSLPFWTGFEAANVALCLLYGLGLGRVLQGIPSLHHVLRWCGVVYLLYLAWGFFRASSSPSGAEDEPERLGFVDGLLTVALNPKIHSMVLVMFSQFLNPAGALLSQAAQLTAAFLVVCVACHFPWIYGGKLILGRFRSERALRIQGWTFGACMVAVAAYVAVA
ncbi:MULTISPECIES: LysE family translocator [Myxococcus]|uniref:LysE family translocator n=1 Tax=Myxococcus llanfairpwllgwyngyllgogerychwyrndrobwllllantysiliogogogochensis TaxID=2590453 RepID=A0A540X6T2_9BACT|nr:MULTISPECIES: LysE family translocator [Myxococcus]NTX04612.1 LysE family translocator [Myxococcus sp. CA040A]TQF16879.1 LysE family translocator [Myxococcus llanfairpwllgwyngyllgogerychwyrndrobwllllantysiliogogogochensis]